MSTEAVEFTAHGENVLEASTGRGRVKTLDDLLRIGKVDLKVWEVEQWKLNKWEIGAKDDTGAIVTEPLFQVWAKFRRRKMKALQPVIQPVESNIKKHKYKEPMRRKRAPVTTALILPDPQFGYTRDRHTGQLEPFHDWRALDIAVQIAGMLNPHYVVYLGDILDLPTWSDKFPRAPNMYFTTQPAIVAAHWWLAQVRMAARSAVHTLLEGNHDKRLEAQIVEHLKEAYDLRPADELALPPAMSIPRLLALHRLGIQYSKAYPNGEFWLAPHFLCKHGDVARGGVGATAKAVLADHDVSVMYGHIHRIEMLMRTKFNGNRTTTIGAYSPGCLCRIDGIVPGRKARQNWQQGLAVVSLAGESAHVQLIEIKDGRTIFGNQLVQGEDRSGIMRRESGWHGWQQLETGLND